MRALIMSLALALAACAGSAEFAPPPEPSPFPIERGSALPPPLPAGAQTAPPEGRAAGGVDFGQWRGADPAIYQPRFAAQMSERLAGKSRAEARADLEANGFTCAERDAALECRIEIMERQCAHDWYVVLDPNRAEPVSGFDVMCLGAL